MSEAAAAIRWLMQQGEPEARRVAVQQVAKVRGPEASELLLRALGDDDWRVRKEAAGIAPSLEDREEVVAALVAALEETLNIGLRNAAVEALVAIGRDAVGAIVESMSRLDADARKLAVEVLGGAPEPHGIAALVRTLADEDSNVRVAAAEALGSAALAGESWREHATQALVSALATSDTFLKIAVLDSLARLEARLPWSVFEPYVGNPLLRRYAIAAAAGSREADAVRALAIATGDGSPTIVREALVALGDVVAADPGDVALLDVARAALVSTAAGRKHARSAALDAEDARARGGALLALGLVRDVADVPALVEALGEDDVAERADLAVRLFGPTVAGPLLASARFAKPHVRASALSLAASLEGAQVASVRDALIEALDDSSPEVQAGALEALGALGTGDDLPRLAAYVVHDDDRIAATATNAVFELAARHVDSARALLREEKANDPLALGCVLLGAIASAEPLRGEDIATLERALAHDDSRVRRAAVEALAQAGGEAAAEAVSFALTDEEHEVKLAAVRALGRLGRAGPLEDVVAHSRDPVLTATALRALGDADPERALAAAHPLISHSDPAVACAGIEAIGHIASSARTPSLAAACEDALFEALDHPEADAARLALSLVGTRPGPRVFARLGLCLDHASWELRRIAAELLSQDRSPAAQALLRARYEREAEPVVRQAIASAISVRPPPESVRSSERA
jgi:HEAT repeat protein